MITPLWFSNALDWIAQVAVLVLAAGLLKHIFKIRHPKVLLAFWRTVVAVSLLLPLLQPWHRQFYARAEITFITLSSSEISQLILNAHAHQLSYWQAHSRELIAQSFAVIVLAGIAARFTILALGLLKLRQFRRASSPISNHAASSAVLDEMRVRVNTGGEFRISSDVDSPVTFGLSAPVILLPERFPTLDAQYQSAIACHELLHVRRRDWAHHLSEEILRAALWFHPAIAWLISRIRLSREQVVDLEVVKLTDARKPYLEALLEFTNSRALATAIPAPPFLVERQLAERVALMLKEVRMSRTRLIASLTAIAACLAVVATLAVWTFPLKASPRAQQNPPQGAVVQGVSGGVIAGVPDGVIIGVPGSVSGGIKGGVSSGIAGGAPIQGVTGGVSGQRLNLTLTDPVTGTVVGTLKGEMSPGRTIIHLDRGGADSTSLNLTITDPVNGAIVGTVTGTIGRYDVHFTDPPTTLTDSYVGPNPPDGAPFGLSRLVRIPLGSASAPHQPVTPVPKIVVTDVKFVGEVHDADAVRARIIKYSQAKNWDATDPDWLDELAEVGVRGDLQDHGYFEAIVEDVKSQIVDSTPTQQRVVASFNVKEGDQFRTGGFTFVGLDPAHGPVVPVTDLRSQFHLQTGDILNVDELRHGIQRITDLYGAHGYSDFTATPKFSIDRQSHIVAMAFNLVEGIQYHVASFTVHGLDSAMTANFESKVRPGTVLDWPLLRALFEEGKAASGANVRWVEGIHITRHVDAHTVDIVLDFPVKPPPSPSPSNSNDSRFIGKLQYIPPAEDSSGKVHNIPPAGKSVGAFQTVAPSQGQSQSTAGQIARAGQNGVTMPTCEYCPRPEYSQEARDANLQGTVYLQIVVLTSGRAGEIKVIKGLEESLDKQAIKVVREKWTFKPATDRNGNPVDVLVPVDIAFQLYGPPQPTPPTPATPGAASAATTPLIPNESLQAKIFKGPVTDNGTSTPFYMGLVNTQTIYAPQPELPRLARQAHVQGPVTLNIVVNTEGKVIVVEYVKGPAMLAQAAIDTVRNWIIKGTHDGAPVTFQISVEVGFNDK